MSDRQPSDSTDASPRRGLHSRGMTESSLHSVDGMGSPLRMSPSRSSHFRASSSTLKLQLEATSEQARAAAELGMNLLNQLEEEKQTRTAAEERVRVLEAELEEMGVKYSALKTESKKVARRNTELSQLLTEAEMEQGALQERNEELVESVRSHKMQLNSLRLQYEQLQEKVAELDMERTYWANSSPGRAGSRAGSRSCSPVPAGVSIVDRLEAPAGGSHLQKGLPPLHTGSPRVAKDSPEDDGSPPTTPRRRGRSSVSGSSKRKLVAAAIADSRSLREQAREVEEAAQLEQKLKDALQELNESNATVAARDRTVEQLEQQLEEMREMMAGLEQKATVTRQQQLQQQQQKSTWKEERRRLMTELQKERAQRMRLVDQLSSLGMQMAKDSEHITVAHELEQEQAIDVAEAEEVETEVQDTNDAFVIDADETDEATDADDASVQQDISDNESEDRKEAARHPSGAISDSSREVTVPQDNNAHGVRSLKRNPLRRSQTQPSNAQHTIRRSVSVRSVFRTLRFARLQQPPLFRQASTPSVDTQPAIAQVLSRDSD